MNTDQAKHHGKKRKSTFLISLVSFAGISFAALLVSFFMDCGMSRAAANFEEDEVVDPEEETEAVAPIENSHPFDKVFRHTRSGRPPSLCFVFTPRTREGFNYAMFVVEHASAALELAESFGEHDEPYMFMFYIRGSHDTNNAACGGYSMDQLQKIANAPRAEAERLASVNSWPGFCQIPVPDEAEDQP